MHPNKYYLGKCAYNNPTRKTSEAYLSWELKDGTFSMSGEIWKPGKRDVYMGGQCVDTVVEFFPDDVKAQRMAAIWKRWHLNDMRAGCEHQRAAEWKKVRIDPAEVPNITANCDEKGVLAIWVRKTEHPAGLLCEPCPVCGYRYGTAWLKEEIPQDIQDEIRSWSNA